MTHLADKLESSDLESFLFSGREVLLLTDVGHCGRVRWRGDKRCESAKFLVHIPKRDEREDARLIRDEEKKRGAGVRWVR